MNNYKYNRQLDKFANDFLHSLDYLDKNEVARELISVFSKDKNLYEAVSEKLIDTSKEFRENGHEGENQK